MAAQHEEGSGKTVGNDIWSGPITTVGDSVAPTQIAFFGDCGSRDGVGAWW